MELSSILVINLLIGVFAGVLAGMFGIGGGVVIVPALILFAGFSITQANGTSLAALLLPVAIFAVISYYRAGYINIRISLLIACGLFLGVYFGSEIALTIPTNFLKLFYSIFLLYVSYSFFNPKEFWKKHILRQNIISESPPKEISDSKYPIYIYLIIGIFAGILSGMFGIGGGLIIVPVLMSLLKFDTKKAIGTSLGALLLPVGLPGVLVYYNAGDLNLGYAIPVAIGLLIGAIFGAKITISLPSIIVKRVYSLFLIIMSLSFIWNSFGN